MTVDWKQVMGTLSEKEQRLVAACLATERGNTGIASVSAETGIQPSVILQGIHEIESGEAFEELDR